MSRPFRRHVSMAALAAAALPLAAGIPAQASTGAGWRIVFQHHYGPASDGDSLFSVAAPTRAQAWAFGGANPNGPLSTKAVPIIEHWAGAKWQRVPLPTTLKGNLGAASAPSANDVWAVSMINGYVLHWNGAAWSVAKRWPETSPLPTQLTGVTAFSATNVWVFGGNGPDVGYGAWHLHGTTWTKVGGAASLIEEASALSASDMWAITESGVLHYNGTKWRAVSDPALSGQAPNTIYAESATSVWLSTLAGGDATKPCLFHFNGAHWQRVSMPWKLRIGGFAPDGHGGWWAVGFAYGSAGSWTVHRSASGVWSRQQFSEVGPVSLALIPGTTSLWGAGSSQGDVTIWRH